MGKMIIERPQLIEVNNQVRFCANIRRHDQTKSLWYSVDKEFKQYISPLRSDAFLVALFIEAMHEQLDIEIEGEVSEKLLYNLKNYFTKIALLTFPKAKAINVFAKQISSEKIITSNSGAGTGFSGGVDSFSAILDHYHNKEYPNYNLSYLVLNNVGAKMTVETFERLALAAKQLELPLIQVDSNINEHLSTSFMTEHQLRNISAVMVLQGMVNKYYYSSTFSYNDSMIKTDKDGLANSETMNINLLSTESLECIPVGAQYSRVDKTSLIANNTIVQNFLDVCVNPMGEKNCSVCSKCMRTQFTLELIGKLDDFSEVFDKEKYKKLLPYFLIQVLGDEGNFVKEISQLIQKTSYVVPVKIILAANIWKMFPNAFKEKIKIIASKLRWNGYQ